LDWQDGFAMSASIGRRFDVFRLEAEFSFMNNRIEYSGAGIPGVGDFNGPAAGNVSLNSYMLNVYHDIKIKDWCWEPYVGAGVGFYQSEINSLYPIYFPEIGAAYGGVNSTSDMPFAYQFRVGASRPLTERTEFFIGYRYFNGADLSFAGEPFGPFAPNSGITNHLEAGLRVNF
jgi:opacity protein-like surface antigen